MDNKHTTFFHVTFLCIMCIFCVMHPGNSKHFYKRAGSDIGSQNTLRRYLKNSNTGINIKTLREMGSANEAEPTNPDADAEEPSVPVEEADEPSVPVKETNEPSVPVVKADEPLVPVQEADVPSVPVKETDEPPVTVEKADEPPVPVQEADEPLKPTDKTEKPVVSYDEMAQAPKENEPPEVNERPGPQNDTGGTPNFDSNTCWFEIKPYVKFRDLLKNEEKYKDMHEKFQQAVGGSNFDITMLHAMLKRRSIAERALQRFRGEPSTIPAGLNLGGFCMMRMPQCVLFFHRIKLRNNTRFRVTYLHNDLMNMQLLVNLSLNDLHLTGHYERAVTEKDPSVLFYRPTYGQVEFLLKDVKYEITGFYKLMQDRLYIENICSTLNPKEILMRYSSENKTTPIKLDKEQIFGPLQRIKNDLDWWLKDYFNDFLIFFGLDGAETDAQLQAHEAEKAIKLNRFADNIIKQTRRRLRQLQAASVKIPSFTLVAVNGLEIQLKDGIIRGLDSIYRRTDTQATIDVFMLAIATVGFSNLKVEYKYDLIMKNGLPPLSGLLVLNGDELLARMILQTSASSESFGLFVIFLQESKAQSLTIEGPANRLIANFRHLLEHHIVAIMSSTLIHIIHQLGSITRCQPLFIGKDDPRYKNIDSDELAYPEYDKGNNSDVEPDIKSTRPQPIEPTDLPLENQNVEPTDLPQTKHDQLEPNEPTPNEPTDLPSDVQEDNLPTDPPQTEHDEGEPNEPTPREPNDLPPTERDQSNEKPESSNSLIPTYAVSKNESVELEFPPKPDSKKGETMLLNVKEKFSLTRLNKGRRTR